MKAVCSVNFIRYGDIYFRKVLILPSDIGDHCVQLGDLNEGVVPSIGMITVSGITISILTCTSERYNSIQVCELPTLLLEYELGYTGTGNCIYLFIGLISI